MGRRMDDKIRKLKKRYNNLNSDILLSKANKERDQFTLEQHLNELNDRLRGFEDSMISIIGDLNTWVNNSLKIL